MRKRREEEKENERKEKTEGKEENDGDEKKSHKITGNMVSKDVECNGKDVVEKESHEKTSSLIRNGNSPNAISAQEDSCSVEIPSSKSTSVWDHAKSLLKALFDLLTNPVYLTTLIGSACFSTGKG